MSETGAERITQYSLACLWGVLEMADICLKLVPICKLGEEIISQEGDGVTTYVLTKGEIKDFSFGR